MMKAVVATHYQVTCMPGELRCLKAQLWINADGQGELQCFGIQDQVSY